MSCLKLHKKARAQTDPAVLDTYVFGLGLSHGVAVDDVSVVFYGGGFTLPPLAVQLLDLQLQPVRERCFKFLHHVPLAAL